MADTKISALTASTTPLAGTEVLPIVQSGTTVKVSVANLTAGRAVTMLSNTMVSASAVNDVDKTGGASYGYRIRGNDQANVRFRFENTGGQIYELVGGNPGASNSGLAIYDATSAATRVYLSSAGDVTLNTGNLVIGTSGKGIDFSADPSAPGMTSELLDDYEEGTWTPTIALGGGSVTYTSQTGTYTKIGRLVTVQLSIAVGVATTPSGTVAITGLPFTVSAGAKGAISILADATSAASGVWIGEASASATQLRLYSYAAGTATNPGAFIANGSYFSITASYEV
jgi:hypothetical protein